MSKKELKPETAFIHTRAGGRLQPTVNPPIERGSTLILPDADALYGAGKTYGRMGLSVHRELEAGLCTLEKAHQARLASSGLTACALAIASVTQAGDHILMADNVYGPTRRFCQRRLRAMGVDMSVISPRIGADIIHAFRDNTVAVFLESPGSLTFEICDIPAIVAACQARNIRVLVDNTWSSGLYHQPLSLGADISIQALTKYVVGHADAFGGAVMTREPDIATKVAQTAEDWGISLGPDEAYACLRGLRTLPTRLAQHQTGAWTVAEWLGQHDQVAQVLHPARTDHPDHKLWQRDFTGACGLFGVRLKACSPTALEAFLNRLELFGLGFSWGGYESLIIASDQQLKRSQSPWLKTLKGPLIRVHVGLEAPMDLIADLDNAFLALAAIE